MNDCSKLPAKGFVNCSNKRMVTDCTRRKKYVAHVQTVADKDCVNVNGIGAHEDIFHAWVVVKTEETDGFRQVAFTPDFANPTLQELK